MLKIVGKIEHLCRLFIMGQKCYNNRPYRNILCRLPQGWYNIDHTETFCVDSLRVGTIIDHIETFCVDSHRVGTVIDHTETFTVDSHRVGTK